MKRNKDEYQLPLKVVSYKDLYGWTMDAIVKEIGLRNNCTQPLGTILENARTHVHALTLCCVVLCAAQAHTVASFGGRLWIEVLPF